MTQIVLAIVGPRDLGEPSRLGAGVMFHSYTNQDQVYFAYSCLDKQLDAIVKSERKQHGESWDPSIDLLVISGGAAGADEIGRLWAKKNQIDYREYPAKWDKLGKAAGFIRNSAIIKPANYVVAFWDGSSKGTKASIDIAIRHKIKRKVIRYEEVVPYLLK